MATVYYNSSAKGADNGTSEVNAYEDLQTALSALTNGDILHCKRGTSREGNNVVNLTMSTSATTDPIIIEGYETTPGDGGFYETFSPIIISGEHVLLKNFDVNVGGDASYPIQITGDGGLAYNCVFYNSHSGGNVAYIQDAAIVSCLLIGRFTTSSGAIAQIRRGSIIDCTVIVESASTSGSVGYAVSLLSQQRENCVINNTVVNESDAVDAFGVYCVSNSASEEITIIGNTISGFTAGVCYAAGVDPTRILYPSVLQGNFIYNCTSGIINAQIENTNTIGLFSFDNAFHGITGDNTRNLSAEYNSVTTTTDPVADRNNFTLNNEPDGGALIKGTFGKPDPRGITNTMAARKQFRTYGSIMQNPSRERSSSF